MRRCFICDELGDCEHREPELKATKPRNPQETSDLCTVFPQPQTKRKPAASQQLSFDEMHHVRILFSSSVKNEGKRKLG